MKSEQQETQKPKKENLKQRAYLNSVTSILDYASRIVTTFFVTPFLVSGLGSTLFGVWKVLGQFTSYTNLADIKATQVLKWAVAKDRDSVNEEELREYITATFILVMMILPLVLITGAIITWYSPQITNVSSEYYSIVRITTAILVLALVVNKVFGIFESVLRGMNLGFKRMGFRVAVFVIGGGLQIAVMLMGYGLIALALIQVLVNLVIGITIYVIVKRHVPWFGWGRVNFRKSVSFFKTSGWFMGWSAVKMAIVNSDKVLLGFLAGPVLVTQYVITEYLIKAARGTVGNVIHGVIPGIGKLYGNEQYEKLNKARSHVMLMTWLMGVTIGSCVIIFNETFVQLWVGEEQYAGNIVNVLILISTLQYMFIQNDSAIINTTLEIRQKVYFGFISALITVLLMFVLVPDFGIIGLCIAIMAGRMPMSIVYPFIITKKTKTNIKVRYILRPLFATVVIWFISYHVGIWVNELNWFWLIGSVITTLLSVLIVAGITGLSKLQRTELMKYKDRIKFLKSN